MLRDPSLIPLSQQHHNGLALCVLTERSLGTDTSERNLARLAQRILDRYELELVNHFEIEEQVLFPALEGVALVAELIGEHRRLESLVALLRSTPARENILAFTELLRRHIRREENELFEEAQRILPRNRLDQLGVEIDRRAVRGVCDIKVEPAHGIATEPRP